MEFFVNAIALELLVEDLAGNCQGQAAWSLGAEDQTCRSGTVPERAMMSRFFSLRLKGP